MQLATGMEKCPTYVDSAVDRMKAVGVILGIVARNPLLRLKGRGQNRMPVR